MKDTGLDHRHRDKDGAISKKHGNTLVGTLRKIYGKAFAAGYPDATPLREIWPGLTLSKRKKPSSSALSESRMIILNAWLPIPPLCVPATGEPTASAGSSITSRTPP